MTLHSPTAPVHIDPFVDVYFFLVPLAHFISKTEGCSNMRLSYCIEECIYNYQEKHCGCHVWQLSHLHPSEHLNVCSQPCHVSQEQEDLCQQQCNAGRKTPCDGFLYNSWKREHRRLVSDLVADEKFKHETLVVNTAAPLFNVELSLDQGAKHPKFTVEYSMTRGQLLGIVGAFLDFWLGLNLVGIIHLFVYVTKQIPYFKQQNPKEEHTKSSYTAEGDKIPPPENLQVILEGYLNDVERMERKISKYRKPKLTEED